ncbi:MAG TPA: FAD-dependent oxidoreductase [Vampirovibrionales bacterium]
MTLTERILSQLPGDVLTGLHRSDRLWQSLKKNPQVIPSVITEHSQPVTSWEWDILVCGGTLGIFIGAALAVKGWRVALIERGILRGRDQEWNISREELTVFLDLGLLTEAELEQAIATQYNPARIQFNNGPEFWVRDVLNIGVDPVYLLDTLKARFLQAGGQIFENTPFESASVHPNGIRIKSTTGQSFTARLLLDVMGHFSPIVRQIRQGQKPDSVCLVVGSCAKGFPQNETGDLITSFTPIQKQCQYFWEAFPAKEGRTTYLFTYLDTHPSRLSLTELFEDYLKLLPEYQKVELAQLEFVRALFGFFPAYRDSPVRSPWDRILAVGDSSGIQSPLSFGGFGAMLRHLNRLTQGIHEALEQEMLSHSALARLQPYQPNISVTWLFQRAMSVGMEQQLAPNQINELLSGVFSCMEQLGDPVLKPFLQDVIQFGGLSQTLFKTAIAQTNSVFRVIPQVGLPALVDWMQHYLNLGLYSALSPIGQRCETWVNRLPPAQQYYCHRWIQAWQYGSGGDCKN